MDIRQIKETCLYIRDIDASIKFYHEKLGFPIIGKKAGRHVFFRAGTSVLLCFIAEATRNETLLPPHFAAGKQHLAFEVSPGDYQKHKAIIASKNIEIIHEQDWKNDLKSFYFEDPDGHLLEIVPYGIWE
ncbi:MAG: VOC family protein [Cytophagales bacterium]|nr:VOC family protein [Cytophagales bacterium]